MPKMRWQRGHLATHVRKGPPPYVGIGSLEWLIRPWRTGWIRQTKNCHNTITIIPGCIFVSEILNIYTYYLLPSDGRLYRYALTGWLACRY